LTIDEWLAVVAFSLFALVGLQIATANGRGPGVGVLIGLILGPIGWVILIATGGTRCSRCGEAVNPIAKVCPHCGREFSSSKTPPNTGGPPVGAGPIAPPDDYATEIKRGDKVFRS